MKKLIYSCSKQEVGWVRVVCLLLFFTAVMFAEIGEAQPYMNQKNALQLMSEIDSRQLIQHAKILSSEKYHGREAGRSGSRLSSKYIINQFHNAGLRPGGAAGSYLQSFKIEVGYRISSELSLNIGEKSLGEFVRRRDYSIIHLVNKRASVETGLVFVGYGISRSDILFDEYKNIDVKGKAALVFAGVPWNKEFPNWDTGLVNRTVQYHSLAYKAQNAAKHGAVCLLITDDPLGWKNDVKSDPQLRNPDYNSPVDSPIPILHLSGEMVDQIMGLSADEIEAMALDIVKDKTSESHLLRGKRIHINAAVRGKAWVGRNIVGILPGRHPSFRHETIVIGAHYDHLGEDSDDIFFGANDNAAGVAAVMELARVFSKSSGSKRTIMFVAFDAEEIGRIGSSYFVDHSPIPARQMVLMINFDMIGKNDPGEINAVATRSSTDLHNIHQQMNRHVGLRLRHPRSYRLGRSDHTFFYYAGVPVMYLFGGIDDDYNTPQDTWDRLIPGKIEKVTRLAFLTAWSVSDREARLSFNSEKDK